MLVLLLGYRKFRRRNVPGLRPRNFVSLETKINRHECQERKVRPFEWMISP